MSAGGRWTVVTLAFVAAFLGVALATRDAWQAQPLFARFRLDGERPWITVSHERPLAITFTRQGVGPESLRIPIRVPDAAHPLEVAVWSEPDETRLGSASFSASGLIRLPLAETSGERLRVELRSLADPRDAPAVGAAELPPRFDAMLSDPALSGDPGRPDGFEGRPRSPLLYLGRGESHVFWLLLFALPLLVQRLGRKRGVGRERGLGRELWIGCLALACAVTSLLLWEVFRSLNTAAGDPDGYGRAARVLADLVTGETGLEDVRLYFRRYPHAHTALISWCLAPLLVLGLPMSLAYLLLDACLGLLGLALFERLLRVRLRLRGPALVLGVWAFALHLVFLRTMARPSPDVLGLVLVVASLEFVLARFEEPRPIQRLGLALLVLLHVLARPQGPALAAFTVVAFALADYRRSTKGEAVRSLLVGAAPLLAVLPFYVGFGWFHNFDLSLRKAAKYRTEWTLLGFSASLLATFQVLPRAWRWRAVSPPGEPGEAARGRTLLLAWVAFYVVLIVAVRAPLWPRHFLPAVPGVVALAALGAAGIGARARMAKLLLAGTAALNLLLVAWQILRFLPWIHAYQERRLPEVAFRILFE